MRPTHTCNIKYYKAEKEINQKMRNIVNISLTPELSREVERAVKSGAYASKSEFFRDLLRLWKEQKLLDEIRESEKEFADGKGRVLKSLKELEPK